MKAFRLLAAFLTLGLTVGDIKANGTSVDAGTLLAFLAAPTFNGATLNSPTLVGPVAVTETNAGAAPGTVRSLYAKMVTGVTLTSGNLVGVRGEVTVTNSTNVGSGVFLYGVQGKLISGTGTVDAGSGYVCGMLGQLDMTGGTMTSGHIAGVISSIQGVGSSGAHSDLFYGESATGTVINSMFKAFGKTTYVLDLESNVYNQMSTTGTAGSTAAKGWLKCNIEGVTRYIPLTDSVS